MSSDIALELQNVSKTYHVYRSPKDRLFQGMFGKYKRFYKPFKALQPVSLTVKKGECLGIVGRNGSGKSTLLQCICDTVSPTTGKVISSGKISALLELGSGFNPDFTGKENIHLNASILGMSGEEIKQKYDDIIAFSGIEEHKINQPVKTYSSGMYIRLAFSVAIHTDPDILIIDEALAVGDELFRRKCYARIQEIQAKGTTILFVSHAVNTVVQICDRTILLDDGEMLYEGLPKTTISHYHKLLFAAPENTAAIREEIKRANANKQSDTEFTSDDDNNSHEEALLEGMVPESRTEQESKGALIHNTRIVNQQGEEVNALAHGNDYRVNFSVRFTKPCKNVRFNYRITTFTGVIVTGNNTDKHDAALVDVKEGDVFEVSFAFKCLMLNGNYYLTLGCSGLNESGERYPLHRISDALMFKVSPHPDVSGAGIVALSGDVALEKVA